MNDRGLDPLSGPFVSERFFRAFPNAAAFVFGPAAFSAMASELPLSVVAALTPSAEGESDRAPISIASMRRFWWAVFEGPARRDLDRYATFARRALVEGFSVRGELRLSALSAGQVARWASELWREDHGCGALDVNAANDDVVLVLSGHPFAEDPLAALTLGHFYQQALQSAQGAKAAAVDVTTDQEGRAELRFRR